MLGLVIAAVLIALVSFGGGWAVNDWRLSGKMQRLQSDNSVLSAANDRCATDIAGVQKAVGVITKGVEEREKAASDAMKQAELLVAQHSAKAAAIKKLPPVPPAPEAQCAAIVQEQINYVESRHE